MLGFLYAQERNEVVVDDAFSQLCEDLWKGVASFEQRSSFRTWMYMVARAALHRTRRTASRREKRQATLSTWEEAAAQVRSATAVIKRTEVKDRFAALRDGLAPEDRELLVLRVDRAMEWADLARVLGGRIGPRRRRPQARGGAPSQALPAREGAAQEGRRARGPALSVAR